MSAEDFTISLKNPPALIGAIVLWLFTFRIINVGTTIAISSIPVALAEGDVISPLFIFDAKYRQYIGELFILYNLILLGILPAIIISIGWSLSLYILLVKGVSLNKSMILSNKATYGCKFTIFAAQCILTIVAFSLMCIFNIEVVLTY
jgi:hypothetical protein